MNYRDSIVQFDLDLKLKFTGNTDKMPLLQDKEKFVLMSEAQAIIQDTHRVSIKEMQVNYGLGVSRYNLTLPVTQQRTDPNNAIIDIKAIKIGKTYRDEDVPPIERAGINEILKEAKNGGDPSKWALVSNESDNFIIEINSLPENDYDETDYPENFLMVYYYPRYRIYDSSYANYAELSDYDETETDYGGEWKLPSDWHHFIIKGAIAKVVGGETGELYQLWLAACAEKARKRPIQAGKHRLGYSLGGFKNY